MGAVFCRVRFIDAQGVSQGEQASPLPEGDVLHLLLSANRYYVSSGMFRRSLLPKMGLPHESVALGDWYLWISVARHAQVVAMNDILADYRLHPEGFQVAQRSSNVFRFWHDHWRFAQAITPRARPECLRCQQALAELRSLISKNQFAAARAALRRGEFSPKSPMPCDAPGRPSRAGSIRQTPSGGWLN